MIRKPAEPVGGTATIEAPPATASFGTRYEARERADGWSVNDNQMKDAAEIYGYRLIRMSRQRAESLVEVLNRGEIRRLEKLR